MSSPLSAPFSVFPSQTPSHNCQYPTCLRRFNHVSELDRHHAIHHSSMGHSPITGLNVQTPSFSSTPSTAISSPAWSYHPSKVTDGYPFPSVNNDTPCQRPTRPTLRARDIPSSASLESLPAITPYTRHEPVALPASSSTASSSSSRASSPTNSLKKFKWPSTNASNKPKRNTGTVMRCGRHGDEWLGLKGWRFWR